MERVARQLTFEEFRLVELEVPLNKPESAEGFPFKFEQGRRMVHELGSSTKGSIDPMTQTSTPKSMEEVVTEVMEAVKVVELFQTMVIVSLNMGNLTMEVNTLKNKLAVGEKEKVVL